MEKITQRGKLDRQKPLDEPLFVLYNKSHVISKSPCFRRREGIGMSEVRVKENESLDSALRRWKKSCARSGVLAEVRKREHYEKPSVRRKKKSEAARKRKFK